MKYHRHASTLVSIAHDKAHEGFKQEYGYLFCDLCGCKPTTGIAGDEGEPLRYNTPAEVLLLAVNERANAK